jgi:hypothetical protein
LLFNSNSFRVQEKEGDKMPQYEIKPMVARETSVSEKVRLLYLNLKLTYTGVSILPCSRGHL